MEKDSECNQWQVQCQVANHTPSLSARATCHRTLPRAAQDHKPCLRARDRGLKMGLRNHASDCDMTVITSSRRSFNFSVFFTDRGHWAESRPTHEVALNLSQPLIHRPVRPPVLGPVID